MKPQPHDLSLQRWEEVLDELEGACEGHRRISQVLGARAGGFPAHFIGVFREAKVAAS